MPEGLDLVEEDDQITHLLSLSDETYDTEDMLSKCVVTLLVQVVLCFLERLPSLR